MNAGSYGIMAEYSSSEEFVAALRRLRAAGCTLLEAYAPFPIEGLADVAPGPPTPIARIMAVAAAVGSSGGYFLQWFAARDYPLNVGGRPLHSWPAFIPVTFELTVLTTALVGVAGFLWLTGLPRLDHPAFRDRRFVRASQDRFFIFFRSDDPLFHASAFRGELRATNPRSVEEVPA